MKRIFVPGDVDSALKSLLSKILDQGLVDYILCLAPEGEGFTVKLYGKDEELDLTPFAPLIPGVPIPKMLTWVSNPKARAKVLAIVKPCMARALVELMKFQQVDQENVLIASVDCLGTIDVEKYRELTESGVERAKIIEKYRGVERHDDYREACKICLNPVPPYFDLHFSPSRDGLYIYSGSEAGLSLIKNLGYELGDGDPYEPFRNLIEERKKAREQYLSNASFNGIADLEKLFEECIGCHNCMEACPICFCKECFYDSPRYDYITRKFLEWQPDSGTVPLLESKIQFHVGRALHMSTSCIQCGLCEQACPNDVNLTRFFILLSESNQALFNYQAGRSLEEEPPLTTFQTEELEEFVGG